MRIILHISLLSSKKSFGVNRIDLISPELHTQIAETAVKRESPEVVDNTPSKYNDCVP